MTEVAIRPTSDLAIQSDQTMWTEKQKAALVQLGVKDASNADLAVFFHQATRTGLDPFARQIYMISRNERDGDQWVTKQTIQTGIDGYRLIARRAADRTHERLEYDETLWCGKDGQWMEAWVGDGPPAAAKVVVRRNGAPFSAVALWSEFVQTKRDGKPTSMWQRMPANQLAKCAEALALRKAFPQDLAGIYTDDEMGQADRTADGAHVVTSAPARRVTAAEVQGSDAIEGEIVQPAAKAPAAKKANQGQMKRIHGLLKDRNVESDDGVRQAISAIIGRELASRRDLLEAEADAVIAKLEETGPPPPPPNEDGDPGPAEPAGDES